MNQSHEFQRSLLQAINDASPDGILVVDDHGVIVSHNRRFMEIWGIREVDVAGTASATVVGHDDKPLLDAVVQRVRDSHQFLARVEELYANPDLDDHCEIPLLDGRTIERHSTALRGASGAYLGRVWYFHDITAQKQVEGELRHLARFDALTGVANRRYFDERAAVEFARSRRHATPLSIAEFDVDHFKAINDRHGHAAGDELLRAICDASRAIIRQTNVFARIGGEEFAVLLTGAPLDGARIFGERIRTLIEHTTVSVGGAELGCTVSVGVAELRAGDTSAEDCLRRADAAMYLAKEKGRNRVEAIA